LWRYLLLEMHIYLDLVNNFLCQKLNKHLSDEFKASKLGFNYVDSVKSGNAWIVNGIYSPSSAENSRLEIGDGIIQINDKAAGSISIDNQKIILIPLNMLNLNLKEMRLF